MEELKKFFLIGIILLFALNISWVSFNEYSELVLMVNIQSLAAVAKSLQSCPTLCDPIDGSPPGSPSPSLGFSRQEYWSGLPFPSPMQESEKWKWSRSVMSDSSRPHGLQPTRLLRPWDFPGKSTGVGCHCLLRGTLSRSFQREKWSCVQRIKNQNGIRFLPSNTWNWKTME